MARTMKIHQTFTPRMYNAFLMIGEKFDAEQSIRDMFAAAEPYDPKDNDHPPAIIPVEPTQEIITAFYDHLSHHDCDIKGAFFACIKAAPEYPDNET